MRTTRNAPLILTAVAVFLGSGASGLITFSGASWAATPIEIPYVDPDSPRANPKTCPNCFSMKPIPITGQVKSGKIGRFDYKIDELGTVIGRTPYGYAKFKNLDTYRRFLNRPR